MNQWINVELAISIWEDCTHFIQLNGDNFRLDNVLVVLAWKDIIGSIKKWQSSCCLKRVLAKLRNSEKKILEKETNCSYAFDFSVQTEMTKC